MARRKSGLTELLKFACMVPWQAAISLVLISFLALHLISAASVQTMPVSNTADLGFAVIGQAIHSVTTILQYLVPVTFLVGAAVSFLKQSRSRSLYDDVCGNPTANVVALTWQEFETLVGEGFRHRGFQVTERGGAAPDGGIDVVLTRAGSVFWSSASSGVLGKSASSLFGSCTASWPRKVQSAGMS